MTFPGGTASTGPVLLGEMSGSSSSALPRADAAPGSASSPLDNVSIAIDASTSSTKGGKIALRQLARGAGGSSGGREGVDRGGSCSARSSASGVFASAIRSHRSRSSRCWSSLGGSCRADGSMLSV
jgi:hypothetical protein